VSIVGRPMLITWDIICDAFVNRHDEVIARVRTTGSFNEWRTVPTLRPSQPTWARATQQL